MITELTKAKTEAEELTELTVKKCKVEYEGKLAHLNQELENALQLRRDSSARRLEATEAKQKELNQLKANMNKDQENTAMIVMKFNYEISSREMKIAERDEKLSQKDTEISTLKQQVAAQSQGQD